MTRRVHRLAATAALLIAATGCAQTGNGTAVPPQPSVRAGAPTEVPTAREGRPASSTRVRFEPEQVVLPGGAAAPVERAATVEGELRVPEKVSRVGWWDGSAYAGDPFGTTVVAGHVDSAADGIGFFARLLRVEVGETITVRGAGHQARYRITSVQTIAKNALATDSRAFDQTGPHRLVMITCTGTYRPDRGGYESNLVVTAAPLSPAR